MSINPSQIMSNPHKYFDTCDEERMNKILKGVRGQEDRIYLLLDKRKSKYNIKYVDGEKWNCAMYDEKYDNLDETEKSNYIFVKELSQKKLIN